ncbi:hypothetical protein [Phaeobacter phage MD18]|nr:hypothetical protein [Phaeobacter phage MD18]
MSWEPSSCPGAPNFDGGWAWEQYNKMMEEQSMITVRDRNDTTDIVLPAVDHVTSAEDAAQKLWEAIFEHAKVHGGAARLIPAESRRGDGWAVQWAFGPNQWADAYVVGEGADAPGFVAQAENGDTVVFRELD